ncbi:MAG: hypothetical protein UR39_C0005G0058 [Candidatus Woesebacteria bacterium GW2011_GWA1_33_30]|uniref:Bacterial spore germination immunoglobulin-like domain-containing protein n=1 Tax=Candidatus Woesebacteria bacterium GW2011_GWA2_33_28 TaxID=1618561 RepID=A0A0G0C7M2_9BACT|nr:MAG: hypothetical protein UR38_C0005G0058 [Candidatus Woesebacteria bacterium GW2011_GWA2_33_28]KKP48176.1 MAG: hypothetical protein UR39_C0005G0058 [Candidatus Woesebacteria bacterium GW2011_GWA1_33_30]KKP49418.1 MAG: hypothetical protein UR40_C0006G0058 [Microgenomates group bacterium GW2011_GWC1_33_32]KKP52144.1 MAG: hypothetical protein UR44_C0004G0058 [Candidatus Woesebacteria bacterium GW2011_GWB1_33_38]
MEPKNNNFLISLLSILLLLSCIIAGFFAWQTQNLVRELTESRNQNLTTPSQTPIQTIIPSQAVVINNIKNGDKITSPVNISGTIDKSWTWEATFSIEILDSARKPLNSMPVSVNFENEVVSRGLFSISISFVTTAQSGFIVVHADNPSGLPQNNKSFEIPIKFMANKNTACTMEAKLCPDGTSVGRSGPNCEFAPCPTLKP